MLNNEIQNIFQTNKKRNDVIGYLIKKLSQIISSFIIIYILNFFMQPEIQVCPEIKATNYDMEHFREFAQALDKKYKSKYGMVKVIPPKGWTGQCKDYKTKCEGLTVNGPIEQNTFGKGGIYQCLHIPKKSMSLSQFRFKAKQLDHITKGKKTSEIQEMFWKNVTFSAPLYGADLGNTLMDEKSQGWNLNNLDSLLIEAVSTKVKGINTSYLYVGSWKAFFCWHTEDLDLSGINYIHEGKSKFWYSVCHLDRHLIEKQTQQLFPEHFSSCRQFLSHKTTLINPYYLKRRYPSLRISKTEHKENEFMFVFGGSFHSGFNFGYNIAEAINYATNDWLRQLPDVRYCGCLKTTVKASPYEVYKNLSNNNKIKAIPEYSIFQQFIFKKAEEDESQQEMEEAKKGISLVLSKKIKKQKRAPKKIIFNNQQYQINNWAQCQKCNIWRIVKKPLKTTDHFQCSSASKQCFKRQKMDKKMFTVCAK